MSLVGTVLHRRIKKKDSLIEQASNSVIKRSPILIEAANQLTGYINWKQSRGNNNNSVLPTDDGYFNIIGRRFQSLPLNIQKEILPRISDKIELF